MKKERRGELWLNRGNAELVEASSTLKYNIIPTINHQLKIVISWESHSEVGIKHTEKKKAVLKSVNFNDRNFEVCQNIHSNIGKNFNECARQTLR